MTTDAHEALRTSPIPTLVLAFLAFATQPVAQSTTPSERALATVQTFVKANETADLELILSTFDEDATVFFPSNGELPPPIRVTGRAEIRRVFATLFASRKGPITITPREVSVQMFDDMAIVTAHLTSMPAWPLQAPTVFPRRTFVVRRAGERWLIVHHHASNALLSPAAR